MGWTRDQLDVLEGALRSKQVEMLRTVQIASLYLNAGQDEKVNTSIAAFVEVSNSVLARIAVNQNQFRGSVSKPAGSPADSRGDVAFFQLLEENENTRLQDTGEAAIQCLRDLLTPTVPRGAAANANA